MLHLGTYSALVFVAFLTASEAGKATLTPDIIFSDVRLVVVDATINLSRVQSWLCRTERIETNDNYESVAERCTGSASNAEVIRALNLDPLTSKPIELTAGALVIVPPKVPDLERHESTVAVGSRPSVEHVLVAVHHDRRRRILQPITGQTYSTVGAGALGKLPFEFWAIPIRRMAEVLPFLGKGNPNLEPPSWVLRTDFIRGKYWTNRDDPVHRLRGTYSIDFDGVSTLTVTTELEERFGSDGKLIVSPVPPVEASKESRPTPPVMFLVLSGVGLIGLGMLWWTRRNGRQG